MAKNIVTKTWTTKSGITKTKTYVYERGKSRRGKVLISKSGKLNKKNVEAFKTEIMNDAKYSAAEKRGLIADLNIILKQRTKSQKKLTTTGFMGEISADKIERMFANAGYSIEEAATELGVTEAEVLDETNWSGDTFKSSKGNFEFSFQYTGNMFRAV